MKLKKIAALALAGVMAVSMLAGCAGKTNTDKNDTNADVTVPATGVSAQVKLSNEAVKLADNATYTAWLSNAISDAKLKTSDLITLAGQCPNAITEASTNAATVYTNLSEQFNYTVNDYTTTNKLTAGAYTALTAADTKVSMGLYTISGEYTQAEVLTALSKTLDTVTKDLKAMSGSNADGILDHTYTVSVSMQKVTSADVNVWFALVTLTETAVKRA